MSLIKPYLYGVVLISLVAFCLYFVNLRNKVISQAATIELKTAENKAQAKTIESERFALSLNQASSNDYFKKVQQYEAEQKRYYDCIVDGSCVVRINASCPKLPTFRADSARTEPALPRLEGAATQNWQLLESGIDANKALYNRCMQQLKDDRLVINGSE